MDAREGPAPPGGPVVVVTTMPLSTAARADLSAMLGDGYVVLDIKRAPTTANVVLTTVVTERTLGSLRRLFPRARILLAELHDADRGIRYAGPITKALQGGPDGYVVAHGLDSLPAAVESEARLQLVGSTRPTQLMLDVGARSPAPPSEEVPPPVAPGHGDVVWVSSRDDGSPVPDGLVLELTYVDDAVAGLLRTSEPRKTGLWASLVAETAVHLAREQDRDVLVDVTGLTSATRAQLRVHVGSERVRHRAWPATGDSSTWRS